MSTAQFASLLQKVAEFVTVLLPMAITFTTLVCLFALLNAVFERATGNASKYRPALVSWIVLLVGIAATVILGTNWLGGLGSKEAASAIEIFNSQFSLAGLYSMAAAIVFDVGAVSVLISEKRDDSEERTLS
jgi:uncharacterized membrane protein